MLKPSQAINKAYRQVKVTTENFNKFQDNLKNLISVIDENESEENTKTHLMDFFKSTYYFPEYLVAQKGRIDFVIHSSKLANYPAAVLFEVKKSNNITEMVTPDNLNRKAMQELLLYYLRERVDEKNTELKYLVITNIYEYFIFDAQEFERIFYSNSKLIKEYKNFADDRLVSSNTDFFYKEIASKYIELVKNDVIFTHFDLRDYTKFLDRKDSAEKKKLIEIYKIFSPIHLLKQSFQNDSNFLDKNFYSELLHILGLEEVSDGGKKIITRKSKNNREEASILENAITILDAEDGLDNIKSISSRDKSRDELLFDVALELVITWINRILFLKLLEAQLIRYQNGNKNYGFLNSEKIGDYDELNKLFFQVLARGYADRTPSIIAKYVHVPYLNSSLFEVSELESLTSIKISNLSSHLELSVPNGTVLKDKKNKPKYKKLPTLEYLFKFLDAYDFSSEGEEGVQEEAKTLINASVLGLIFEKINGHSDGAVFTPGFVTMYMCREAITRCVLSKFNEHYGWQCGDLVTLYNKIDDIEQANRLINSLKICDPAVGSGHFLVSALNEIIRIKYELGVLTDSNGKRIKSYKIDVQNDELIIYDDEGNLFGYNSHSPESQRVQETLFREKQTIIENCLFGVDINPNSVKICRLRLWIELLKNAYYTKESNYTDLETLPNIDINIKCGNSLLHRFAFDTDLKQVLKQSKITISEYKEAVSGYKNAPNKSKKKEILKLINTIKSTLRTEIAKNDPRFKKLRKNRALLTDLEAPLLFKLSKKEQKLRDKDIAKVKIEVSKLQSILDEIETNKIYLSAFEWRFEFPEVLDDEGKFLGFDCIIGNPPYIQLQKMGADADALFAMGYQTFVRTGDVYCLFYELGMNLLKPNSLLSFIISNTWMRAGYGSEMRRYCVEQTNPIQLIDFSGFKVFDTATVNVNIIMSEKSDYKGNTLSCVVEKKNFSIDKMSDYTIQNLTSMRFSKNDNWAVLTPIEQRIKAKIEKMGKPLKEWDINIYRGVLTGYNKAFIIDAATKDALIAKSSKNAEIIRPILRGRDIKRYKADFADLWIIATFPSKHYNIDDYPGIKEYLLSFGYDRLKQTGDTGARKKTNNQWFETQDSINYWEDFSKQKIVWKRVGSILRFCYDDSGCMALDSTCFATGNYIKFLVVVLNSKLGHYLLKDSPQTGTGDLLISVQAIEPIRIPVPNSIINSEISFMFDKITEETAEAIQKGYENKILSILCRMYEFTIEETEFIESQ